MHELWLLSTADDEWQNHMITRFTEAPCVISGSRKSYATLHLKIRQRRWKYVTHVSKANAYNTPIIHES